MRNKVASYRILITIGLLAFGVASYATTFMRVKTRDGRIEKYDVSKVVEVFFEEKQADSTKHGYMDLGLPSGILWATCNIGATKPDEFGDYFAWGETQPKDIYKWSTYKWAFASDSDTLDSMFKYNFGNKCQGTIDSLSILAPEDDAAAVNWGAGWRMPTIDEFKELFYNCEHFYLDDGLKGTVFVGSGGWILLPLAGERNGSDFQHVDEYGHYWSSSLYESNEARAFDLFLDPDKVSCSDSNDRHIGFPIRPVIEKKDLQGILVPYTIYLMKVKTRNGEITTYDVKDIVEVDYEEADPINYEYVDLGLPSGTLWATFNVGATKPEEFGDYFAWGEIDPKKRYYWSNYKWANGGPESITKYITGNKYSSTPDNLSSPLPEDDAATANWGEGWRMPTTNEIRELINNCEYSWVEVNGVKGAKYTASNGNSIFLPLAGVSDESGQNSYYGCYWAGTIDEIYPYNADYLCFTQKNKGWLTVSHRYRGYSVRPVRSTK